MFKPAYKKNAVTRAITTAMPLFLLAGHAAQAHQHPTDAQVNDGDVITVTAPLYSPLTIVTSPKTPRQPVPASDGSDYLKTIPGFSQIRNGGTNGDPVFRGMFGSRLKILTDGSEMLGACPSRMDAPTSYISPESFDLLTITKGPQTVLWGPGSSAGTVRFERERPRFDKPGIKGNASVLTGSNGRWDENIDASLGAEQGYLRVMANKSRANDYQDGTNTRVPSRWDKWNGDLALGWTPDADTLLEVTMGRGNGEARYAGRSMDGSQFKRESLGMRVEKSNIGEVLDKLEAQVYYNYANHVMDNVTLRSPGSGGMGGHGGHGGMNMGGHGGHMMSSGMTMQLDRRTVGGRVMGTWQWQDVKLESGLDTQTNTHRSMSRGSWEKDAQFNSYGAFGELTWSTSDQDKLIGGARLDRTLVENFRSGRDVERSDTLPSGFMRLEHTLAELPLMLYAGVGYTERFPDYWELFSPKLGPNGSKDPFSNVKSEKTTQLDIGAQYNGKRFNGWVSAYVGRVDDFILFKYDPHNARLSQADNVNANIMGGEMGMGYQLSEHWKTDASLAYSWGKNTSDGRPLPQIPPLEARLGLTYEYGDWSGTGLWRLVSSQHRVAINEGNVVGKDFAESAGFGVLSANAAYKVNKNVKLSAGLDNILNKTYSEHLNLAGNSAFGYSANSAVNEPGRTLWAKVNVTF
ncbi:MULTISPECIES: TonB-dependent copper receptor [Serratia]|uniref:TonB-dependent copper receptor n=1 Tax=Serratia TaxID=613 RepID=UPI0006BD0B7D|nr:TonB-dependent receptor [Serratia marcescens]AYU90506.1 TonB-dependent copper receptor [Serratia sp. LS-1]MBF8441230.1 TonB-dependent copper receptor [Serratia ureilytica]ASL92848.1 TonB-dependent copper receptor [Serratia marcescens]ASM02378.1 TonB-dependent copper receptor [Serratia marcescens]